MAARLKRHGLSPLARRDGSAASELTGLERAAKTRDSSRAQDPGGLQPVGGRPPKTVSEDIVRPSAVEKQHALVAAVRPSARTGCTGGSVVRLVVCKSGS